VDIARTVAAGEGLVCKIRGYFFGDGYTVPHPAASLRSPLYPWLMGHVRRALGSDAVHRWFNFGLWLVNACLLAALLSRLFARQIAAAALLLAGLTEPAFVTSIFPWAEQTASFFRLVTLLLAARGAVNSPAGALAVGLAGGLGALSRPEYALVAVAGAYAVARTRTARGLRLALFTTGLLIPLGLFAAWNLAQYGRA